MREILKPINKQYAILRAKSVTQMTYYEKRDPCL